MRRSLDAPSPVAHFSCLDMIRVTWASEHAAKQTECSVVLEIWGSGALLQLDHGLPVGLSLRLTAGKHSVRGTVQSCEQDDYGYLVSVAVDLSTGWFPTVYRPPYLRPKLPESTESGAAHPS